MQPPDGPDGALDAAYRRTRYEVHSPDGLLVLQIDTPSLELAVVHRELRVDCSAFLTAWNPRSVPSPPGQNAAAHRQLQQQIGELGLEFWPGWGRDPAGEWPAEQSLFVAGLALADAGRITLQLGQNAIVHAAQDCVPRLIWLRPGA